MRSADESFAVAVSDVVGFAAPSGRPEGGVAKASIPAEPPRYTPEERAEQTNYWTTESWAHPLVAVPEHKQLVTGMRADNDGRIWLQRTTVGVKGPPRSVGHTRDWHEIRLEYSDLPCFSVFQRDGSYLGDVSFPAGARVLAMTGDVVWAAVPDSTSTHEYLVKYRIPGITGSGNRD